MINSETRKRGREVKKVLIVAITSNRGLAGAFNSNVVKQVRNLTEEYKGKNIEAEVFAIGKKGNDVLKKTNTVVEVNTALFDDLKILS